MVQRILKLFYQELGGLHKTALLLAVSSIGSGLLGLFRDRLLAGTFGASRSLDIYYAAFRIPDLLYNFVVLSLVSVTALIPLFLKKKQESEESAHSFLNSIFTFSLLVVVVLSLVLFFLAPNLVSWIAPGFSLEDKKILIDLTRIMLLSSIFLGISNLFSSVIQSFRRFFVYASTPIFYNLGIITGILGFYPLMGLKGLALGVVLGAFLHMFIQVPTLINLKFLPFFTAKINFSDIKPVFKLSLPRSLGLGLNQIVFVVITAIASGLTAGSIAVFNLSFNLQSVILGVIGVSYSVAAFPTLAKLYVKNKKEEFISQVLTAARQIIFWSIPAVVFLIVLRAQIVRVILGTGAFGWTDTRLVAGSLALFAISLPFQMLSLLFIRSFYAAGKTKEPLVINLFSSGVIIFLSFFFVKFLSSSPWFKDFFDFILRIKGEAGTELLALPLSFSLGMILNALILALIFSSFTNTDILKRISKTSFQSLIAAFSGGVVSYFSLRILDNIFDIYTFFGIFLQGLISGVLGLLAWVTILYLLKNRELFEIFFSIKQKFWKASAIAPEPEEL